MSANSDWGSDLFAQLYCPYSHHLDPKYSPIYGGSDISHDCNGDMNNYPDSVKFVGYTQPFVFFYLFLNPDEDLSVDRKRWADLRKYWVDTTDERLKGYAIIGVFVTKLGPYLMRNRKPFVLREVMIAYNLVLVVLNAYFIYASLKWLEFGRKSWNPRLPPSNQWSDKAIAELPENSGVDLCDG
ncbi:unnamed protein product [Oppiella nova]|uniref:Uncharacterized protein n=1 Tax=Oppiella nova TaxID=334625 RepID=A0A7R9QID0_9ACAR|nr:unnamed protein product [Oppiella nova]CAG2166437.1 unnamed protein product [Oppiella nova]